MGGGEKNLEFAIESHNNHTSEGLSYALNPLREPT